MKSWKVKNIAMRFCPAYFDVYRCHGEKLQSLKRKDNAVKLSNTKKC